VSTGRGHVSGGLVQATGHVRGHFLPSQAHFLVHGVLRCFPPFRQLFFSPTHPRPLILPASGSSFGGCFPLTEVTDDEQRSPCRNPFPFFPAALLPRPRVPCQWGIFCFLSLKTPAPGRLLGEMVRFHLPPPTCRVRSRELPDGWRSELSASFSWTSVRFFLFFS